MRIRQTCSPVSLQQEMQQTVAWPELVLVLGGGWGGGRNDTKQNKQPREELKGFLERAKNILSRVGILPVFLRAGSRPHEDTCRCVPQRPRCSPSPPALGAPAFLLLSPSCHPPGTCGQFVTHCYHCFGYKCCKRLPACGGFSALSLSEATPEQRSVISAQSDLPICPSCAICVLLQTSAYVNTLTYLSRSSRFRFPHFETFRGRDMVSYGATRHSGTGGRNAQLLTAELPALPQVSTCWVIEVAATSCLSVIDLPLSRCDPAFGNTLIINRQIWSGKSPAQFFLCFWSAVPDFSFST